MAHQQKPTPASSSHQRILGKCDCDREVTDGFINLTPSDDSGTREIDTKKFQIRQGVCTTCEPPVENIQMLKWNEVDFTIKIPTDALDKDTNFDIDIIVSLSGDFKFPDRTRAVSAIYGIASSSSLSKPVTLKIEHCFKVNVANTESLAFALANDTKKRPPYTFQVYEEGNFSAESRYGEFTTYMADFSWFVILVNQKHGSPVQYLAYFFSQHFRGVNTWKIKVAVVQNTKASKQVAQKYSKTSWKEECQEEFYFAEENIHLGLPKDGRALDVECWKIEPLTSDVILRKDVESYDSCASCSSFEVLVTMKMERHCHSTHKFYLHGAQNVRFCTVFFSQEAAVGCTSISNQQELDKAVAEIGDWEALCQHLGTPQTKLKELRFSEMDVRTKKRRCLEAYHDTGSACWEHVVKIVAEYPIENKRLAKKIADKHNVDFTGIVKEEL